MGKEKNYKIKDSELLPILTNWYGADGCFATDKIICDGGKINYMYREQPVNSFDSGWRFFEGSESTGYLNNPENSGAYTLNRLCNYDRNILPFLKEPVGSAYKRNVMGIFEKTELE